MTDNEKYEIIKKHRKPVKDFPIPKKNGSNLIVKEWFKEFAWLAYSESKEGCFCMACVLFGHEFPGKGGNLKNLYTERFNTSAKNAHKRLSDHESNPNGLHKSTVFSFTKLIARKEGRELMKTLNLMLVKLQTKSSNINY